LADLEIVGRDLFADDISPPGHAIGYSSVFDVAPSEPEPFDQDQDQDQPQHMYLDEDPTEDSAAQPEPSDEPYVCHRHARIMMHHVELSVSYGVPCF
jgi:hypothetical protein